jgi:hypothetical protein
MKQNAETYRCFTKIRFADEDKVMDNYSDEGANQRQICFAERKNKGSSISGRGNNSILGKEIVL